MIYFFNYHLFQRRNKRACQFCYNLFAGFIKSLQQEASDKVLKNKLRGYCYMIGAGEINSNSCTETIERYYVIRDIKTDENYKL